MEKKDKKNSFSDIAVWLHTKNEADIFLTQIDILSESLFTKKVSVKEKVSELFSSEIAAFLTDSWKNAGIDGKNMIELHNYLAAMKETIKHLPVLTITIAFKPKQTTTQRIFDWVHNRLKTPLLLNIKVEKQIIGGAIIEFHGKYLEYTVHKTLVEKINNG